MGAFLSEANKVVRFKKSAISNYVCFPLTAAIFFKALVRCHKEYRLPPGMVQWWKLEKKKKSYCFMLIHISSIFIPVPTSISR